jgi:uncharacterized oligopeptide transporter (OPT) family protein
MSINITALYISGICLILGAFLRFVPRLSYKLTLLVVAPLVVAFTIHYLHSVSATVESNYFEWAIGSVLFFALRGLIFMAITGFLFGGLRVRT